MSLDRTQPASMMVNAQSWGHHIGLLALL